MELQPLENVYPTLNQGCNVQALECDIDEIESRFDDLCRAKSIVAIFEETGGELDEEMRKFHSDITKTMRTFRSAISTLHSQSVEKCLKEYENALNGNDNEGKFVRHWRYMLKKKVCYYSRLSITRTFKGDPKWFALSGVRIIRRWEEMTGRKGIKHTLLITCILSSQRRNRFVQHNTKKIKLFTQRAFICFKATSC